MSDDNIEELVDVYEVILATIELHLRSLKNYVREKF